MSYTTIGDALFTKTQQRVLGLLFGKPDRRFYSNEIVRWADMGRGTVRRELQRLTDAGVLVLTEEGKQHYYQVNKAVPVYSELLSIVRKTFGVGDVIREALMPMNEKIHLAFVYGSVAKCSDTKSSDIDLMLVGEKIGYGDVIECLAPIEKKLERTINPTIFSQREFSDRVNENQSFIMRVLDQPKLMIKGVINEFRKPS